MVANISDAPRNYRVRVYEHGKAQGFLCPGGKLNRRKVHASLLTKAEAEFVVDALGRKQECIERGATFKVTEG